MEQTNQQPKQKKPVVISVRVSAETATALRQKIKYTTDIRRLIENYSNNLQKSVN